MSINLYSYQVAWSPEDEAFVARVLEFPSLAAHGDTQEQALGELRVVVDDIVEDLRASGEPVPAPFAERQFSGKLNLRMPQALHRSLAQQAAREGVSLNQLILFRLSQAV